MKGYGGNLANDNCLDGMQCPKCFNYEPFDIEVLTTVRMTDDGTDWLDSPGSDTTWENDSYCQCVECGHSGKVQEFKKGFSSA